MHAQERLKARRHALPVSELKKPTQKTETPHPPRNKCTRKKQRSLTLNRCIHETYIVQRRIEQKSYVVDLKKKPNKKQNKMGEMKSLRLPLPHATTPTSTFNMHPPFDERSAISSAPVRSLSASSASCSLDSRVDGMPFQNWAVEGRRSQKARTKS